MKSRTRIGSLDGCSRLLIRKIRNLNPSVRGNRGISSLFTAIFITLLAVVLVSLLFFGLNMTEIGLTRYIRLDQEKSQESIDLYRIESDSNEVFITSLQVINTGSITLRLKALYIGNEIICDPSDPEVLGSRAYIEPKENVTIPLFPSIYLLLDPENLNAQWTVTSERGTRSSEKGIDLWKSTDQSAYTPDKFYFGPLMLSFDLFHWKSGAGPWIPGWTIPKSTRDVSWRIFVTNIDDRNITLTDRSSFTLVGNDNIPNSYLLWYLDPDSSDTHLVPNQLASVTFSGEDLGKFSEEITCKNFLLFTGYFTEADGTITPFGQTIPFEAVLITDETMAASITLTADPVTIRNDGASNSIITITVKDAKGNAVPNRWVDLYSSAGTLSQKYAKTDVNGQIQVTLTSSLYPTIANVVALCQGITGNCKVLFTAATHIVVIANPAIISKDGTSTITVQLLDQNDEPVIQHGIVVTISLSDWTGDKKKPPTLIYQTQSSGTVVTTTDSNGQVVLTLAGKGAIGRIKITASANGLLSGTTQVTLI